MSNPNDPYNLRPSDADLAAAIINTKVPPYGLSNIRELAKEARAYHALDPYPLFHFKDWKTEERGTLPRCMPFVRTIVERGARWLFGKPLQLHCPKNPSFETFIRRAWRQNRMNSRLVALAERGGLDGGAALKFSFDSENKEQPLSFQTLSVVDQVRFFYHPHDRDRLLMARVQYPYLDPVSGKTKWHREEWTAEKWVKYLPVDADRFGKMDPDTHDGWIIATAEKNPLGVIPVVHIKNSETDDLWGCGDLWGIFRVVDRVNLTFHLMDRSNQFDSNLNPIFIDSEVEDEDLDRPMGPAESLSIKSREGEKEAKVVFPPSGNALRPAMMVYAKELLRQLHDNASSVDIDTDTVTNRGNLTQAVLEQLYFPLIEGTNEKRKTYGENGLGVFFTLIGRGLQNAGYNLAITDDEESHTVNIGWPAFFELTEEERLVKTQKTQEQEMAGYLPHERAVEEICNMEGRLDVQKILDELKKEPSPAYEASLDALNPETEDASGDKIGYIRSEGEKPKADKPKGKGEK